MKNTQNAFLLLFVVLSFTALSPKAWSVPWRENYGRVENQPGTKAEVEAQMAAKARELNWLYEKLFPIEIRESAPTDVSRTFQVHLLDTYEHYPDPVEIRHEKLRPLASVKGMITYISIFQKKYHYDVQLGEDGALILSVKIHLKNPTPEDVLSFQEKVAGAEALWNSHAMPTDFAYRFKFEIVKTAAEAPFSVKIQNSTRGPYDTFWGRDWTPAVVAHEIGHMMGLGDEYQPFGKAYGCYIPSLMCSTLKGAPMPHHYYFILRRLVNP